MGKFDDFDLDIAKVSSAAENTPQRSIIITITTLTKLDGCSGRSCACSSSDITACRAGVPGQNRC